ncbi:DUF2599 domain-containing protein [Actinotalea sp. Marseille-Q4924]|uniref:DUF2599 domain-containing protein n=1 Tax=Actinotalea sp. Marseille-Q4924 TaxID=2866571 RepID=UPI001CE4ACB5|nr:DUF2599 domain-containing protein [Actinotalea sp. Marseille-Q4924]
MRTGTSGRRSDVAGVRGVPGPLRAAIPAVALLLLGGCGTADEAGRPPAPPDASAVGGGRTESPRTASPEPAPSSPPSADDVRRPGRAVTLGEVTVHVAAGHDAPEPPAADDGAVTLPVPAGAAGTSPAGDTPGLVVAGPVGSTVDVLADGTAVVRGADGAVVAGVVPRGARVGAGADGLVEVSVLVRGDAATERASVVVGVAPVVSATWEDRGDEGGLSLVVVPRDWVRTAGAAGVEAVWSDLGARTDLGAGAVAPGMRDQLECHALGAPDKESWNLEPWRPDVGLLATLAARCNPD